VKIAVLDTGIDLTDSFLRGAGRIIETKDWADPTSKLVLLGRKPLPSAFDAAGHGTHITALLLQIAPDCDVYIGRVADASGSMVEPDKIAEVRVSFHTCKNFHCFVAHCHL
jgi:hypothetical protein